MYVCVYTHACVPLHMFVCAEVHECITCVHENRCDWCTSTVFLAHCQDVVFCSPGDTMGCGIYFPVDYEPQQVVLQAEEEEDEDDPVNNDSAGSDDEDEEDDDDDLEDEHEEEDYIDPQLRQGRRPNTKGVVVEVRFCV